MFGTGKTTMRIRNAARALMREMGRPVSVLEIRTYIAQRDERLAGEVRGKSEDYVRVTMSSTGKGEFVKFGCPREMELREGESSKKLFWGLKGEKYEESVWRALGASAGKTPRGRGGSKGSSEVEVEVERREKEVGRGQVREGAMESEPEEERWVALDAGWLDAHWEPVEGDSYIDSWWGETRGPEFDWDW
jgi:hypothetical protein